MNKEQIKKKVNAALNKRTFKTWRKEMANFVDTDIKVQKIDNDGFMEIQIGPEGFTFDLAEIAAIQNGSMSIEGLKINLAISLKLSGVDLTDEIKVKDHIEKKSFKYFR